MQPSSLIFLVIIAIWAAYLLQHWVRRREHLATARSVDRFSDAMRVLERRALLPEPDLSAPQPRSYAISPARSSRPEVVVKRAQSQSHSQSHSQSPRPNHPTHAAAVRPTRSFHALAGVSARRVRGLSLLVSVLLVIIVTPLAAMSMLAWWSIPVVVAVLVTDFVWLRHAAAVARAARRSAAANRSASGQASSAVSTGSRRPVVAPSLSSSAAAVSPARALGGAAVGEAEVAGQAEAVAEVDLSGWAPVPVPPPTYTLKAKADRPAPIPAEVSESEPALPSSFDGLVDEGELDGLLDRRRASGA